MLVITVLLLTVLKGYFTFTQDGSMYDKCAQCSIYGNESAILTTSFGTPVTIQDTSSINTRLILNNFFLETLLHFATEKTIPRIVHDRGTGAFGYFKVTNDLSDICKAKVFDTVGKITPVAVRLSLAGETDSSDLMRENRGFAVKFYTEEGNYDQLGLTFPMFSMKDPVKFPAFIHTSAKNPHTNLDDENSRWDFHTSNPESLHFTLRMFGDLGIPDGFRHMPMHTIHTFVMTNHAGKKTFVRFFYTPDLGIKTLTTEQAKKIQGEDLDYATRDLYNAIAAGNYPSWTLKILTLKEEDLKKVTFDIFDMTKIWPLDNKIFSIRTVGTLVLNENPRNHFADIQQLAFSPGRLAPGIQAFDSLFEARVVVYQITQTNRLGNNFNKIRVNCPFRTHTGTYLRDGPSPVGSNGGCAPNYFPNSYPGPKPTMVNNSPQLTFYTDPTPNNFDQARDLYTNMTKGEKNRLIQNIVTSLKKATLMLQEKAVKLYHIIHPDLSNRIKSGLKKECKCV